MAAVTAAKTAGYVAKRQAWSHLPKVSGCVVVHHRDASTAVSTDVAQMKRGTGGRSSFSGTVATVFGATGFLGRYVCNKLGKIGSQIIIPYRCEAYEVERLRLVGDLGQVLFFPCELNDEEAIRKCVQYSNVVINLIGREWETKNFPYHKVHVEGARRLARIAKEAGVEKFIHMSHLNAKENPQKIWTGSKYLESKYQSELAVREEFPEAIIFKSADMFGAEDTFLHHFNQYWRWAYLRRRFPVWKKGEYTIKQPVYVADVAAGIVQAIRNPDVVGKIVECVGPQRYYLADIIDYILDIIRRKDLLQRSEFMLLVRLKAQLLNMLPTRPYYHPDRIEREGITDWTNPENPTLEDLGVTLTQFDDMARFLLFPFRHNAHYQETLGEFADPVKPKPAEFYQGKRVATT